MSAGCQATSGADGMRCAPCGLQWDHDDKDPPACGRASPMVEFVRSLVDLPSVTSIRVAIPLELADDLAQRMAVAYDVQYPHGGGDTGRRAAMRAAYRVFLDSLGS